MYCIVQVRERFGGLSRVTLEINAKGKCLRLCLVRSLVLLSALVQATTKRRYKLRMV